MGGTHWEEVLSAQEYLGTSEKVYVRWLNVAPSDAQYVYALASIKYYHQGIFLKSTDGGDTWTRSNSEIDGKAAYLAVDPQDPLELYVGTWYSGVYRSHDGGSTWQSINRGLPTTWASFLSVAIDPANSQRIYLGMEGTVYYSADGGDAWIQVEDAVSTEQDVGRITHDPQDPRNVYATVWNEGVYRLVGWDPDAAAPAGGSFTSK